MANWIAAASPRFKARTAGALYLITIAAGTIAFVRPSAVAAGLIAGVSYVGVTLVLYLVFKPVQKTLSLIAALLSLAGIVFGALPMLEQGFNITMALFGCYCLLIGYLVVRSALLPRVLGALLALGGLGYLLNSFAHFLHLGFAARLFPYALLPGFIAETLFCLWLLIFGLRSPSSEAYAGGTPN